MLRFKKQKIIEREREDGTAKSIKIPKSQIPLLRASQRHAARTSHNPRPSTPQSHSQTSTRRRRCRFRLCAPALQLLAVPRVALSSVRRTSVSSDPAAAAAAAGSLPPSFAGRSRTR